MRTLLICARVRPLSAPLSHSLCKLSVPRIQGLTTPCLFAYAMHHVRLHLPCTMISSRTKLSASMPTSVRVSDLNYHFSKVAKPAGDLFDTSGMEVVREIAHMFSVVVGESSVQHRHEAGTHL